MDSSVFLDALDIGYFNAKLLWILADMGDGVGSVSLCSGFVKKIMNSYLVKATQDTLKTINNRTATTQSETESIFLYLLTQMLLNLTQYTDKNLPNKTRL
ncbi:hypothetical protein [Helicobacter pylori]|uniref:hypothetical protein n=1 Tax=Helicobacter pylori TaxID=210 RepID=UPI00165CC81B|nr:hypothetical protein [Helicobacter pylori]